MGYLNCMYANDYAENGSGENGLDSELEHNHFHEATLSQAEIEQLNA